MPHPLGLEMLFSILLYADATTWHEGEMNHKKIGQEIAFPANLLSLLVAYALFNSIHL